MHRNPDRSPLNGFMIFLAFLLGNWRALIFIFLFPDTSILLGPAWIEIALWVVATFCMMYLLIRDGQLLGYWELWTKNRLLLVFILVAITSLVWTIASMVTLFRVLELLFATLIAAFVGMRYRSEDIMDFLFWFGAVIFILSMTLVFSAPRTGTMYWVPFYGAWRGVYWHRNHLGSITALLSSVFLCRTWISVQARNNKGVLDAIFYLISMGILYFTKSATGYILFVILHAFLLVVFIWLRIQDRLHKQHYLAASGFVLITAALVLTNLDFVFGLFNRDATMTGRVGLWQGILTIANQRPWLGHGFGAFWTIDSFREQIRQLAGWTSQPLIADNGLLDIYLHLGVVGIIFFVGILVATVIRSLRYAVDHKTLTSFFPLLVIVYALFANITFSLFAETEVFVWFLIIAALFMTTPRSAQLSG